MTLLVAGIYPGSGRPMGLIVMDKTKSQNRRRNQMSETSTLIAYTGKITREELAQVPTPPGTAKQTVLQRI
jgi:hypothetical protein